jgi:hypothetical protein
MNIRRPVAAVFIALSLVGGPATLTACGDPSGLDRNDGDSSDNETGNTGGAEPGDESQGNLPRNDSNEVDEDDNETRDEGEEGGDN